MFRLQLIVDSYRPLQEIEPLLDAGVDCLQVRIRDDSTLRLLDYVESIGQLATNANALVSVNGRVDIALGAGAHGVQVGRNGISVTEVRRIAPDLFVGVSVHSIDEAKRAESDGADSVTFGHVFETPSHPGQPARGLNELSDVVAAIAIPVVAIGGIDPANVEAVRSTGASGVAVIGAIWNVHKHARREIARRLNEGMQR